MIPGIASRIDSVCDNAERLWKVGTEPDLVRLVDTETGDDRVLLAAQLVLLDSEYRIRRDGRAPSTEEYAVMFDMDADTIRSAISTLNEGWPRASSGLDEDKIAAIHRQTCSAPTLPQITGYELLSELGRGGMGVVYKARQIGAGRLVAIKVMSAGPAYSDEVQARFLQEAKAIGSLSHPHIVPIYDVGVAGGIPFFSMLYIDGPTLEERCQNGELTERDVVRVLRRIADATAMAHSAGIVHRDIKPQNIMLDASGHPYLVDFGLARADWSDAELTATGQFLGTPRYMAPEQALHGSRAVTAASDVFSLGATLYRCLGGVAPFRGSTPDEILLALREQEPVSLRILNPKVSRDLDVLCHKCLEKRPDQRLCSAAELAAELQRFLDGVPIRSRAVSRIQKWYRWSRRHPSSALAGFATSLLVLSVITGVPVLLLLIEQVRSNDLEKSLRVEEQRRLREVAAEATARADTATYYADVARAREAMLVSDPAPGWTWKTMSIVSKAGRLRADGRDPAELRSLIANLSTTVDLIEVGRIDSLQHPGSLAVSSDGSLVAAGDANGLPLTIRVWKVQPGAREGQADEPARVALKIHREIQLYPFLDRLLNTAWKAGWLKKDYRPEGIWNLAFSPDNRFLAAATRNGSVFVWNIADNPKVVYTKRFQNHVHVGLAFGPDGDSIFVSYTVPTMRQIDLASGRERLLPVGWCRSFAMDSERAVLSSAASGLYRFSLDFDRKSRLLTKGNIPLCVDQHSGVAAHGEDSATLFCPESGKGSLPIQQQSEIAAIKSLEFAADGTLLIGRRAPENLLIWDSLSGDLKSSVSYLSDETPLVVADQQHGLLFVGSTNHLIVYAMRSPGNALAVKTTERAGPVSPEDIIAPGADRVGAFSVSDETGHIALLESPESFVDSKPERLPTGYRARVHLLSPETHQKTTQWTFLSLADDDPLYSFTEGESLVFLRSRRDPASGMRQLPGTSQDQVAGELSASQLTLAAHQRLVPNEESSTHSPRIAMTAPIPGTVAVLSENTGFHFLPGNGLDVVEAAVTAQEAKKIVWRYSRDLMFSEADFRPVVLFRVRRPLKEWEESLQIRRHGSSEWNANLEFKDINQAGWYFVALPYHNRTSFNGDGTVEIVLTESALTFAATGQMADEDPDYVESVRLILIPITPKLQGQSRKIRPLRLGPLSAHADGGLSAVYESWTLRQWNAELTSVDPISWTDAYNHEEDIRSLSDTGRGTFLGTDSGLTAIVPRGKAATVVESSTAGALPYESRRGVLSTTVCVQRSELFAGTREGQIRRFSNGRNNSPPLVIDAHRYGITAMACDRDGRLLASGDTSGVLKFWENTDSGLTLKFQLTNNSHAAISLQFSADGRFLYVLRHAERGVRRLDLQALEHLFERANCGVD